MQLFRTKSRSTSHAIKFPQHETRVCELKELKGPYPVHAISNAADEYVRDVPFYQLPYIDMRGIPVARYQDENVALVEAELRWNATSRWAFLAFAGAGCRWGTSENFGDADTASAGGVGFRRLVARRFGMYMGIDVAIGPEETAFYIQAGSAWR